MALDENSARTEPSHNNDTPDQARPAAKAPEGSGFGRKQGALLRPVSAGVSGRFGSARPSGGVWRGLFFAADHAAVRSVAAGRVEYAADLRGYGNTVIISHGDGYLSVYGGLSSLAVGNGSSVAAGQSIGSSGTLPSGEQGLYFELRYRGRTINPQSWLR